MRRWFRCHSFIHTSGFRIAVRVRIDPNVNLIRYFNVYWRENVSDLAITTIVKYLI